MALTLKALKNAGVAITLNPDDFVRKLNQDPIKMNEYIHEIQVDDNGEIVHHQWQRVQQTDGKTRTKVVEKKLQKNEFVSILHKQTADFIEHCDRVKAQYKALNNLKDNLPDKHVIVQMDFAENFTCSSADEVQSAYWNSTPVTLHPIIVYYKEATILKHKSYVIVSDDLGHNIGLVYAILKELVPEIKETISELQKIHYWTDSPSSQYRNKTAFYLVSDHEVYLVYRHHGTTSNAVTVRAPVMESGARQNVQQICL